MLRTLFAEFATTPVCWFGLEAMKAMQGKNYTMPCAVMLPNWMKLDLLSHVHLYFQHHLLTARNHSKTTGRPVYTAVVPIPSRMAHNISNWLMKEKTGYSKTRREYLLNRLTIRSSRSFLI